MTPANPDNNKPFIYRIADALGITHLVVAVQHSHLMSEIEGLVSALAGKMDNKTIDSVPTNNAYNLVSSKGVYDALMAINNLRSITSYGSAVVHAEAGNNPIVQIALQRTGETSVDAVISLANIANLKRALLNPDTTPTADSDNLVTSGGVKAALDGKPSVYDTEVVFMEEEETPFIYLPEYFTHGEKQKTFIMDYQGASTPFADIFYAQNTDIIRILSHDDEIINITECFLSFRVIRQANGIAQGSDAYYVIFDGKNEY